MREKHITVRGELALAIAVIINTLGVVLMLKSGAGISAISSVPYAFNVVFPSLSLGTWTYIFQTTLILLLMLLRHRFVFSYLFSFLVGFVFGVFMDIHETWIMALPSSPALNILYFIMSYVLISFGIAVSNRCRLPIIPTDLFPRELEMITKVPYSKVKISFDLICLAITALLTYVFTGRIMGLGIGTVAAAFTMGKAISLIGKQIDKKFKFVSFLSK